MNMKTQYIKMYEMLLKLYLGKFIALNACIRPKKKKKKKTVLKSVILASTLRK